MIDNMPSHVSRIESTTHPKESLLLRYEQDGHYTDCFRTDISRTVTHSQFVAAFYTTFLFRIERFILKWAVSKPSTDTEAAQLADEQLRAEAEGLRRYWELQVERAEYDAQRPDDARFRENESSPPRCG